MVPRSDLRGVATRQLPLLAVLVTFGVLSCVTATPLPTSLPTATTSLVYDHDGTGWAYNGTIPTELGLLTEVTTFQLTNQDVTGTIPTQASPSRARQSFSTLFDPRSQRHTRPATLLVQLGQLIKVESSLSITTDYFLQGVIPTEIGALTGLTTGLNFQVCRPSNDSRPSSHAIYNLTPTAVLTPAT